MSVHDFIKDNSSTFETVTYILQHFSHSKPLFVIFSGAIDKFVCVSWFYRDPLNVLWIKDVIPHSSYTDPLIHKLITQISSRYSSTIFYGMSMGGVGALLLGSIVSNTKAVICVDCEPRGISQDEFFALFNPTSPQSFKVHLISCSNHAENAFHTQICNKLQNWVFERCPLQEHLSNVPSKQYLSCLFSLYTSISDFYINAWDKVTRNDTNYKWM